MNTYFVQLALDVGMCDVTQMAEKLGVESSTADAPISSYDDKPSFTLGTVEVSPLSVAEAYATFASGGIHCDPVILDSITDGSGQAREVPERELQAGHQRGRRRRGELAAVRGDDQGHRRPRGRPPTAVRRPARPAPSTATRRSGSPATPRRSPAPR